MIVPDWILKIFGHKVADKLGLQEDTNMETKPWYQSKTIWAGLVAALIGVYNAVGAVKSLPPIPDWIFTILGAIGVYSRVNADTKIG
jgi:hypothetical protein